MLPICFCSGKNVQHDKEYHDSKSDCFRGENIRGVIGNIVRNKNIKIADTGILWGCGTVIKQYPHGIE